MGLCSNRRAPLWQTSNDVTYCEQLPTVEAGGGSSDYTQLIMLLPNVKRHTARKCTRQQQQQPSIFKHCPKLYLNLYVYRFSELSVNSVSFCLQQLQTYGVLKTDGFIGPSCRKQYKTPAHKTPGAFALLTANANTRHSELS